MADQQALSHEDHFEIVEALYQEATLTLSDDERVAFEQTEAAQKTAEDEQAHAPTQERKIIRSRKPAVVSTPVPIFTRISDLYEEAEATHLLASEEDEPEAARAVQPDDDFTIPETFDTLANEMVPEETALDETALDETARETEIADKPTDLSDDDMALLGSHLNQDEAQPSDDVAISTQIEPAIALDDVLEGLLPPEETPEETSEAEALAQLEASRPQADDELAQQLADVKSAVEHAQITPQVTQSPEDMTAENTASENAVPETIGTDEALASVITGPDLARFIGETVREVLDEELPHLVRGLVDEALGERQGRYGRSETPHIGLRTKPSRH